MDNNRPDPPPIAIVPTPQDRARWLQLEAQRKSLRARIAAARQSPHAGFEAWVASPERKLLLSPIAGSELVSVAADKDGARIARQGVVSILPLESGLALDDESPWPGVPALKLAGKPTMKLPGLQLTGDEPFSMASWIYLPKIVRHPGQTGAGHAQVIASQMTSPAPASVEGGESERPTGWVFEIDEGVARLRLLDSDGKTIRAQAPYHRPIAAGTWNHLTFTYDGSRKEDGYSFYLNGLRLPIERGSFGAQDSSIAPVLNGSVKNAAPLTFGSDALGEKGLEGLVGDFRILDRVITEEEAQVIAMWPAVRASASKDAAALAASETDALKLYYLAYRDPGYQALLKEFAAASAEHRAIELRSNTAMVLEEREDSRATAHVLFRGMYDQPRELVEADTPSFLPPMAPGLPRNRLGLARWIVDPANPLFSRVTVNRLWQEFFGSGIVESTDDFGAQAEAPSHPELLDWLAVEFRESGWDVKKLVKLIVTSATYRQSSAISKDKLSKDPDNVLLARGPRFRLDGEVVRDSALAASGLLVTKLGGPPVKPYQPAGVWEGTSMVNSNTRNYKQDTGESLYRRSLYTLWKRSAPPASMDIFDGPTREVCVVRRDRTNTPLQALVTMNDPQFVEAARSLAQRALRASRGEVHAAIDFMTVRILARTFTAQERQIAKHSYDDFLAHYRSDRASAARLLSVGESPADRVLPVPELAALTMVANQLFSLDEALNK
jgi:hypothetical protein